MAFSRRSSKLSRSPLTVSRMRSSRSLGVPFGGWWPVVDSVIHVSLGFADYLIVSRQRNISSQEASLGFRANQGGFVFFWQEPDF